MAFRHKNQSKEQRRLGREHQMSALSFFESDVFVIYYLIIVYYIL